MEYEERRWKHDEPEWRKGRLSVASGPWDDEPDKIQWVDSASDLDCLMVRNPSGNWCGYVGVDKSHPFYEVDYDGCPDGKNCSSGDPSGWSCEHSPNSKTSVHGSLTFTNSCDESAVEGHGICHLPYPGRTDDIWWLGFDTAHSGDQSPADAGRQWWREYDTYKDEAYVRNEVENLAKQLKAVADDAYVG